MAGCPSRPTLCLTVGGATPVAVTVPVDNTNQSVADLVANINSALAVVGLRAQVTAGKSGNAITLTTNGFNSLTINSVAGDTTQTELQISNGTVGQRGHLCHERAVQ